MYSLPANEDTEKKIILTEETFIKISQGDNQAFADLYTNTYQAVYGFLLSILNNREEAEDVLQETYIKIRENASRYKHRAKPMAWILTIAKNLAYMKLRKRKRISMLSIEDAENVMVFSDVTNAEERMVLEKAFQVLNMEERQIVILHAVSGLKHKEISKIVKKPLSTVLSKYNRAIKKLEKAVGEDEIYDGKRHK